MRTLSAGSILVAAIAVAATVWTTHPETAVAAQTQTIVVAIQDLNLTDAQEEKIADIRKEYRPKIQEAAKALNALVKALARPGL